LHLGQLSLAAQLQVLYDSVSIARLYAHDFSSKIHGQAEVDGTLEFEAVVKSDLPPDPALDRLGGVLGLRL